MSDKKNTVTEQTNSKKSIITDRFRNLVDKSEYTREAIASATGLDTSTVTKYYNGDRQLTIDAVKKFSTYFNVSADYLLGLSDAATNDKDLQFICDYTGLSEEAVKEFEYICMSPDMRYSAISDYGLNGFYGLLEYTKLFPAIREEMLKSDCFKSMLEAATTCKVLNEILEIILGLEESELKELNEEKCDMLLEFLIDYQKERTYQIYNAQNGIMEFIEHVAPLLHNNSDDKEKLKQIKNKILLIKCKKGVNNGDC